MAFIDKDGRAISYECNHLIEDLKKDIATYGENVTVQAWVDYNTNIEGIAIFKDYDLATVELTDEDKKELERTGLVLEIMPAGELLEFLIKQNEVL